MSRLTADYITNPSDIIKKSAIGITGALCLEMKSLYFPAIFSDGSGIEEFDQSHSVVSCVIDQVVIYNAIAEQFLGIGFRAETGPDGDYLR